jgi:HPt (histidine-containing phosphotransfer) domain-containing protein
MQLDAVLNKWFKDKQSEETLRKARVEATSAHVEAESEGPSLFTGVEIPGLDAAAGLARYGTEKVYLRTLDSWVKHTPAMLDDLALKAGQWADGDESAGKGYTIAVHGLKGASYGVSAQKVGKLAEKLEAASRAGDLETVKAENPALLLDARSLVSLLSSLLEKRQRKADTVEPLKDEPSREDLKKLYDAAKHFKPLVMEDILANLEKYHYARNADLVPWLREQADNLEYDAISERLEKDL